MVGWVERYAAARDGAVSARLVADGVLLGAADGGSAHLALLDPQDWAAASDEPVDAHTVAEHLASAASASVPLLVVAIRRGGWTIGTVRDGRVLVGATGRRYVQGQTAAGGWSQQRFARRRDGQADKLVRDAVVAVHRVLAQTLPLEPVAVVLAGDRSLADDVADRSPRPGLGRLGPLEVGEPRRVDLDALALRVLAVRVTVRDAV